MESGSFSDKDGFYKVSARLQVGLALLSSDGGKAK